MKVNLKKVKPLSFDNSNIRAEIEDHGPGFLRNIIIRRKLSNDIICAFYQEDARALRDWLNKALPNE